MNRFKIFLTSAFIFAIFSNFYISADIRGSDYISENSVASVVKLSSYYTVYEVEGLDDNYEYSEKNGEPDFENGKIIGKFPHFEHIGTGVIVTKSGLIFSNAHVTDACKTVKIENKINPQGNTVFGSDGKAIKYVEIPVSPSYMFAEAVDLSNLKKNDDSLYWIYLAKILTEDTNYDSKIRDRSILQISSRITLSEEGEPIIDKSVKLPKAFPYSQLANPFEVSYLENRVKAIGYPSVGDPNRSAKTSGELLGYESSNCSKILHSSWISGGNSGGGLFYNDKLIGINTWDNQTDIARPVAIAQPIVWWIEMMLYAKWLYPEISLPNYSYDWINSDPSNESYKNNAYVKVQVSYKSNPKEIVSKGQMLLHREDWPIESVIEYRQYEQYFNKCWQLVQFLWNGSTKDASTYFSVSEAFAERMKNITSVKELRPMLNDEALKYFDIWTSGDFIYSFYDFVSDGKMVLVTQKNSKYELSYVDENGDIQASYHLSCDDKTEQGPYTIWLY